MGLEESQERPAPLDRAAVNGHFRQAFERSQRPTLNPLCTKNIETAKSIKKKSIIENSLV